MESQAEITSSYHTRIIFGKNYTKNIKNEYSFSSITNKYFNNRLLTVILFTIFDIALKAACPIFNICPESKMNY